MLPLKCCSQIPLEGEIHFYLFFGIVLSVEFWSHFESLHYFDLFTGYKNGSSTFDLNRRGRVRYGCTTPEPPDH